jgi:hypothetical protein
MIGHCHLKNIDLFLKNIVKFQLLPSLGLEELARILNLGGTARAGGGTTARAGGGGAARGGGGGGGASYAAPPAGGGLSGNLPATFVFAFQQPPRGKFSRNFI